MNEYKEKSRATFNAQATTYDTTMQGAHARRLYPQVLAALADVPDAGEVLDVGCGTGALARLVLEQRPLSRVTCLDLAPNMVAQARINLQSFGERAQVVEGDSDRLPFRDESFDAAYCNDSFHHYPDPEKASFEMWRVLRPGGLLVVGDAALPAPARALMNAFIPYSSEGDVRMYSRREFERILGRWFSTVAWENAGKHACIVRARK